MTVERADALLDAPAIDLEFRFAGPARTDAAAQTRQIRADADQVRLPITQLGQFDLEFALAAARVPGEDVEDQHRAIDDRKRHDALEILALPRPQIVEDQHNSASRAFASSAISSALPLPTSVEGSTASRRCTMRSTIRAPAALASASNSASSGSNDDARGVSTAATIAVTRCSRRAYFTTMWQLVRAV